MRPKPSFSSRGLLFPVRVMVQRGTYVALLIISIGLIVFSRIDPDVVDRVAGPVFNTMRPVLTTISEPLESVRGVVESINRIVFVFQDNARLREDNERLMRWQAVARSLEQENVALRSALRFNPDPRITYVTARIVSDSKSPFIKTRVINAGQTLNVENGMAVLTGHGIIGRIVQTAPRAARVLLLTDLNSRIPVSVIASRHRAILVGDNTQMPRIEFPTSQVGHYKPGDRIVTSGDGGVLPAGLMVGDVVKGSNGQLRVRLSADLTRLDIVRIARYHMPLLSDSP